MNKEIKTFIGTNPLKAVEADRETAVGLIAEFIGLSRFSNGKVFRWKNQVWRSDELAHNLNFIHEAEKAVIEKVNKYEYCNALMSILIPLPIKQVKECENKSWTSSFEFIVKIATASAEQRIAAMLTALSEVEK